MYSHSSQRMTPRRFRTADVDLQFSKCMSDFFLIDDPKRLEEFHADALGILQPVWQSAELLVRNGAEMV